MAEEVAVVYLSRNKKKELVVMSDLEPDRPVGSGPTF
jgi:hypothetical protein